MTGNNTDNKQNMLDRTALLAKGYVPEWSFDTKNPDIGSTIAMIYAAQAAENADRMDQIIDRYHTEFINLLDISVKKAIPAKGIVKLELVTDTVDGVLVAGGTRFLSGSSEGDSVVFESVGNVYVTSAKVKSLFMTNADTGNISVIKGNLSLPGLIDETEEAEEAEIEEDVNNESFVLFGERAQTGCNALKFYHDFLFADNDDIIVKFAGNTTLVKDILAGEYVFYRVLNKQLCPFEKVVGISENEILLKSSQEAVKQPADDDALSKGYLILVKDGYVLKDEQTDSILFSSRGEKVIPEYAGNGTNEFKLSSFSPFNQEISLYQECYIGMDSYFKKAGAKISIEFDLTFREKLVQLNAVQEEAALKIIKKKQKTLNDSISADVYIQEISFEYFNGTGWRRLPIEDGMETLFAQGKSGHVKLDFICPPDWESSSAGAYDGRAIRLMVLRADNCYMRPALFHYPHIEQLNISFNYENRYMKPKKTLALYGTVQKDITSDIIHENAFWAFRRMPYMKDMLYIGLTGKIENGPVSMYIRLNKDIRYNAPECSLEYSSREGFKPLKIVDDTGSFSRTGTIRFLPPIDFSEISVESQKGYYLRVVRKDADNRGIDKLQLPLIEEISLNGINVQNTDTYMEDEFYIDEVTVGAQFTLNRAGILDAEVWVNETGQLSRQAMKDMLLQRPDEVRCEKDNQDNITAFYVLWKETERFESSKDRRVYMLDRLRGILTFGDGISTEIPRCVNDIALKVKVRTSDGVLGNVPAGAITASQKNLNFIGDIYNPDKIFGGSNMESPYAALKRGAILIAGRKRLVSMSDYIREIMCFSDIIDSVSCIKGMTPKGEKKNFAITFILLMKDYKDGSSSYHRIKDELLALLLSRAPITMTKDNLFIAEPVFVEICVTAWLRINNMQDAFELKTNIEEKLSEYFNPVSDSGSTWKIGTLPTKSQIMMKINTMKKNAVLANVSITARYNSDGRMVEKDLSELKVTPMMVCTAGKSNIHIDS